MSPAYTLPAGTPDAVAACAKNLHVMLWQEMKEQCRAVRCVLYRKGLAYSRNDPVPEELRWARLTYSTAWFSAEGDRRFVTPYDHKAGRFKGPRLEIPPMFVTASPAECRRIARVILAGHAGARADAEILKLRSGLVHLDAA
ncbi:MULTISPECIES: hypothetical protein [Arthrobacter]|uniref:Uncharacterized protein n=1 Tax=Arthrobacter terricola TaxID=2547396 RepID=A0A4R5JYW4_9MICC|nr:MULTISPECIES: hypothetical protein [Arthrobacter]MBT8163793.1 hypothetical protein [Arthrobacter sp. GN70]TDF83534.1 hypothetical protein E1809_26210 [Arthrobacter terricola]